MLPSSLQEKIDQILETASPAILRKAREHLSQTYREVNSSKPIFANEEMRLAYLGARFPATYAASHYVIWELLKQKPDFQCQTLLDLGSGPATATLAAMDLIPEIHKAILMEKSQDAIQLGKQLLTDLSEIEWICKDLKSVESFPSADLAILSYSLGEIKPFASFIDRLWKADIDTLAIIEPGTPKGYQTILEARDLFLRLNAHIIAPCPHAKPCPLKGSNWCHFSTRLERTKLHRLLKEGTVGFEDEKFSYLIVSRDPSQKEKGDRILRHPFKGSGHVRLTLCTGDGMEVEKTISKKDKEIYRKARNAAWGDSF
jgi:ribosomal protein RSM22 (predicted rRNA methylase)